MAVESNIHYDIFPYVDGRNHMNWVGKYTYGTATFRGQCIHFRFEHAKYIQIHELCDVEDLKTWKQDYEIVCDNFYTPINPNNKNYIDNYKYFDNGPDVFNVGDENEFSKYSAKPTTFDLIRYHERYAGEFDFLKPYCDEYKYIYFVYRDKEYDISEILLSNDENVWEKIQEEMHEVYKIGNANNVEFYWV